VIDRGLGVYLALYYITMSVVALRLWQRGTHRFAVMVMTLPLTAYLTWAFASLSTPTCQLRISLAVLPLLAVPLMASVAWTLRTSRIIALRRLGSRIVAHVDFRHFTPRVLVAASVVGVIWLMAGLASSEAKCDQLLLHLSLESLPQTVAPLAGCALPGIGPWPAILLFAIWLTDRVITALAGSEYV
jgi:hypothetical protein